MCSSSNTSIYDVFRIKHPADDRSVSFGNAEDGLRWQCFVWPGPCLAPFANTARQFLPAAVTNRLQHIARCADCLSNHSVGGWQAAAVAGPSVRGAKAALFQLAESSSRVTKAAGTGLINGRRIANRVPAPTELVTAIVPPSGPVTKLCTM